MKSHILKENETFQTGCNIGSKGILFIVKGGILVNLFFNPQFYVSYVKPNLVISF